MAKSGLTFERYAEVVTGIRAAGGKATYQEVLEVVGGGVSFTTLAAYRKRMDEEARKTAAEEAPRIDALKAFSEAFSPAVAAWVEREVGPYKAEIASLGSQVAELIATNDESLARAQGAIAEAAKVQAQRLAEVESQMAAEKRAGAAELLASQMETRALAAEKRVVELEGALAAAQAGGKRAG